MTSFGPEFGRRFPRSPEFPALITRLLADFSECRSANWEGFTETLRALATLEVRHPVEISSQGDLALRAFQLVSTEDYFRWNRSFATKEDCSTFLDYLIVRLFGEELTNSSVPLAEFSLERTYADWNEALMERLMPNLPLEPESLSPVAKRIFGQFPSILHMDTLICVATAFRDEVGVSRFQQTRKKMWEMVTGVSR